MRNLKKIRIAVIGGTGFEKLFEEAKQLRPKTPYGAASPIFVREVASEEIAFLPRHGPSHSVPPHKINFRANIFALHKIGVERVLATGAVGAINRDFKPGDLVIPHDFVDFTRLRTSTFYEKAPVTHVDFSQSYCPEMRELLIRTAKGRMQRSWGKAVLVCTEGPRYETPAEIEMFRRLGCDIVGMTCCPEAVLARELEMCYAAVCYVSNMAAGMQERLTAVELSEISKKTMPVLEEVLIGTIKDLPTERGDHCPCSDALRNSRFQ
jgi:5'-methylthioadenosine phosphorylase